MEITPTILFKKKYYDNSILMIRCMFIKPARKTAREEPLPFLTKIDYMSNLQKTFIRDIVRKFFGCLEECCILLVLVVM